MAELEDARDMVDVVCQVYQRGRGKWDRTTLCPVAVTARTCGGRALQSGLPSALELGASTLID